MADTVTMYDPSTGTPVEVSADQAGAAYRAGKATFAADQQVPVRIDGRIQLLPAAEAAAHLQSAAGIAGGGLASSGQLAAQQLEDQYGGLGGALVAGAAGAARAATLGGSDVALTGLGMVAPETLRGYEQANPVASLVGEGLGVVGATALSGGLGGVARGGGALTRGAVGAAELVSAPARAASALGRGVEAVGGALLGEGAGARMLTSGAAAAAEGALFGTGQAISRATLDDAPLTGEKLVAAAGHGALLGGATGAGLSAVGSLLRGAAGKVGEGGLALARRLEGGEASLAGELAQATPKTEAAVQAMASRVEREMTLKATGANQGMIEKLGGMGDDVERRVVRQYHDEIAQGGLKSAAEKEAAAAASREAKGKAVSGLLDELGASGAKADIKALVQAEREKITQQMLNGVNPDLQRAAKQADEWMSGLESKLADGDIKAVWQAKRELGAEINWKAPAGGDRYNELKKDLYFALDREITRVGTESADKVGAEFAARWANANAEFRAADWLAKATEKGAAREAGNRVFGLSEQAGALAGALVGGGGLGGLALSAVGAWGNHLIKKYGAQLARAASRGELVGQVSRHVDQLLGERVGALVGGGRNALAAMRPATPLALVSGKATDKREEPRKVYEAKSKAVTAFLANPGPKLQAATAGLEGARPEVRQAVEATVMRGAEFLASKMPRQPPPPAGLPPHLAPRQPLSPAEASTWNRYERAVNDPLSVLEDAKRGVLTAEAVEAVQAVYPSIYRALQAQVAEGLMEREKPLSWRERLQLGTLLGLPTDPNLEPDAIRLYQRMHTAAPEPSPDRAPGAAPAGKSFEPPARPMKPQSLASKGDQLAA
jgi:hypothetical protein